MAKFKRARIQDPITEPLIKPLRVVVIEDFPPLLRLYLKELKKVTGIQVEPSSTVESIEGALNIFERAVPDIVITDLSLTEGRTEGFDILKIVKAKSPSTTVILTSSAYDPSSNDPFAQEIRSHGFDAVFPKLDHPLKDESPPKPRIEHLKNYLGRMNSGIH
ncbi:MAG: response regulator [Candidatus Micrarchaeia archaeon]